MIVQHWCSGKRSDLAQVGSSLSVLTLENFVCSHASYPLLITIALCFPTPACFPFYPSFFSFLLLLLSPLLLSKGSMSVPALFVHKALLLLSVCCMKVCVFGLLRMLFIGKITILETLDYSLEISI